MNNIPKIIHYCWFGNNPKPQEIVDLIENWKEINPDFIIKEWNESNFDLNLYEYCREAYEMKRFAFVTDVVRLYALYNEGGIYMDTDVETLKPFGPFLHHPAFTGCENAEMCVTGTMGSMKHNPWIKLLLDQYNNKRFLQANGEVDLTTNTTTITELTKKSYGWKPSDNLQDLGDVVIYPTVIFCAKSYYTGEIYSNNDTVTIHHFKGSWKTESEKNRSKRLNKVKNIIINIFGDNFFNGVNKIRKRGK